MNGGGLVIETKKRIVRNPSGGTPHIYFPKQIFDAVWGHEDEIPVKVIFEGKNRIVIQRITDNGDFIDADSDAEVIAGR